MIKIKFGFVSIGYILMASLASAQTTVYQGSSLCGGSSTARTNNANSITISNAINKPSAGTYYVNLEYLDYDLGSLVSRTGNASISISGSSVIITFPTGGLPSALSADSWPTYINIASTGSPTTYTHYVYFTDGTFCDVVLPVDFVSFTGSTSGNIIGLNGLLALKRIRAFLKY